MILPKLLLLLTLSLTLATASFASKEEDVAATLEKAKSNLNAAIKAYRGDAYYSGEQSILNTVADIKFASDGIERVFWRALEIDLDNKSGAELYAKFAQQGRNNMAKTAVQLKNNMSFKKVDGKYVEEPDNISPGELNHQCNAVENSQYVGKDSVTQEQIVKAAKAFFVTATNDMNNELSEKKNDLLTWQNIIQQKEDFKAKGYREWYWKTLKGDKEREKWMIEKDIPALEKVIAAFKVYKDVLINKEFVRLQSEINDAAEFCDNSGNLNYLEMTRIKDAVIGAKRDKEEGNKDFAESERFRQAGLAKYDSGKNKLDGIAVVE